MKQSTTLAPIVLFGYKRPVELQRTIDALQKNHLAAQSDLFVFIDGPKKPEDEAKVQAVRQLVDQISGFRSVQRVYSDQNRGLATSVINGVTQVIAQYGNVIVLEDDLLTAPNFLDYMNAALTHYRHVPHVFSISGYTFPFAQPVNYPFDAYVYPRTASWGWATWADRWASADWNVSDYDAFMADRERYDNFEYYGSDRPRMLRRWRTGEIDSWAIRWCYAQAKQRGVTVYPTISKIRNIGFSRDSTNTSGYNRYDTVLDRSMNRTFRFPDSPVCNPYYVRHMRQRFSLSTRLTSRLLSDMTRMGRWLKLGTLAGLTLSHSLFGQQIPDTTTARQRIFAEVGGIVSSATKTPFWLRSRQYGIIPLASPSAIARVGGVSYLGDPQNSRRIHVKIGAETVVNVAPNASRILLPEAYASARLGRVELYAGRRREVFGLTDTLLSSGSYAWSGNAMPIPKIQLGTRGFVPLGFTKGVLAINAFYAHGWFSNTDSVQRSYLHQKALFGRVSLLRDRVRLYGGVTHHAQWGGLSDAVGNLAPNGRLPSSLRDYWRVVSVDQPPVSDSTQYSDFDLVNRVGNHLGSIDLAVEVNGQRSNWYLYVQHPFEDKSGVAFQNLPDGLYGIRWQNAAPPTDGFRLLQVTAEVLTTMNQGGFTIKTGNRQYDGADDYFNNYQYRDGWTHQQRVLGTPFLTRYNDTRPDLYDLRGGFGRMMISNNRVQVLHLGVLAGWPSGVQLRALVSHSQNFGRPIWRDPRVPRAQFSGLAEAVVPVRWLSESQLRLTVAVDRGNWLTNNVGGMISFQTALSQR